MSDPLEPFRAELRKYVDTLHSGTLRMIIWNWENHKHSVRADRREFNRRRYRAAKSLHIAMTESPAAALMWKLTN